MKYKIGDRVLYKHGIKVGAHYYYTGRVVAINWIHNSRRAAHAYIIALDCKPPCGDLVVHEQDIVPMDPPKPEPTFTPLEVDL